MNVRPMTLKASGCTVEVMEMLYRPICYGESEVIALLGTEHNKKGIESKATFEISMKPIGGREGKSVTAQEMRMFLKGMMQDHTGSEVVSHCE